MRRIVRALAVLSVGGMLILLTGPAQAAVQRIGFSCLEYGIGEDFSGARGWEAGNTFHGRNGVVMFRDLGTSPELGRYCAGTDLVIGNINQNLLTGVGQLRGTFRYELDAFPGSGFEGTFQEQVVVTEEGWASGEGIAHGYGELEGWQMRMSIQELFTEDPSTRVSGYVFNPGA